MIETSPAKVIGRKKSPIQTIEDEFSTGRIQLGGRSGGNEDEPICAVCMDPVINHNDGVDILLACKCRIHYECLIGYIRNQMTDRITLLGHGKDGIICPYISISGCRFSQVFYAENRARRQSNKISTNNVVDYFINVTDLQILVKVGVQIKMKINAGLNPLTLPEVNRLQEWIDEGRESIDDSNLDPFVVATTKACPVCQYRGTHFMGHDCHHISPFGGCPRCRTHYCYSCLSSSITNQRLRGDPWRCECGKVIHKLVRAC